MYKKTMDVKIKLGENYFEAMETEEQMLDALYDFLSSKLKQNKQLKFIYRETGPFIDEECNETTNDFYGVEIAYKITEKMNK
jgi:hypothetical protein